MILAPRALFVTGTDTGVGKTLVTALIALRLRQMGVNCGAFKPFASGCARENGVLQSEDAEFLHRTLALSDSLDEICPIRLEEPLAPLIAARRAGISTRQWPIIARDALRNLQSKYDCVVVEGVGGLLAPIWEDNTPRSNADLIGEWQLPTVLVARRTLGTINHTLLTLNSPLQAPASFVGLIFNDAAPISDGDIAAQTSAGYIAQQTDLPIWGQMPFCGDFTPKNLQMVARNLEILL